MPPLRRRHQRRDGMAKKTETPFSEVVHTTPEGVRYDNRAAIITAVKHLDYPKTMTDAETVQLVNALTDLRPADNGLMLATLDQFGATAKPEYALTLNNPVAFRNLLLRWAQANTRPAA